MKKVLLAAALAALAVAAPASADESTFTQSGQLAIGNPMAKVIGGITEIADGCTPGGTFEGVDGWWIELPAAAAGKAAAIETDGLDVDVWFYTADCSLMLDQENATSMAEDLVANEEGTVPVDAVYAVVDLSAGAAATFTFTAQLV